MAKKPRQPIPPVIKTASPTASPPHRPTGPLLPVLAAALLYLSPMGLWAQSYELCRIGFTHEAFGEVNENDAIAAMRAWTRAFVEERKIPATLEPSIYNEISDMRAALTEKSVEMLNMTTTEFSQLRSFLAEDIVIYGMTSGSIHEEYVLLANRDSSLKTLGDLQDRTLGMLSSVRASLAMTWVDTILLREGLAPAQDFFSRIDRDLKTDNLLIPLFFGKLDACVITRRGFDIMVELNPQTGKQLEVLSSSPPLVPGVLSLRKGWDPPVRETMVDEIRFWDQSPAGQQSLALFQIDGLEARSVKELETSLELIDEHRALLSGPPDPAGASAAKQRENPP